MIIAIRFFKKLFTFVLLPLLFFACHSDRGQKQNWMTKNGKIKVLSTTAMIDDLVKNVGGEYVDGVTLIKGELNPHSYQLVKGDDEKLKFADIIFFNGLGLEHGPSLQHYLESSSKAIGLGNLIFKENPDLILSIDHQVDPHIWMDIGLWSKAMEYVAQTLSAKDPDHAAVYQANAAKYKQQMDEMNQLILSELQSIPEKQRYLVTSHDAFNYFTRAYLAEESEKRDKLWIVRFAAPEGLSPESQLSAKHIQWLIDYLLKHQIHMLFPESNVSKDSIKKIVDAGVIKGMHLKIAQEPLYADAMGPPGSDGDTYLKMVKHNADVIAKNLKKNHP
jgi:manganese/zinc/iron transport system substrate-binding protein